MDKASSCVPMEEGVGDMEDTSAVAVGVGMREKPSLGLLLGGVNPAAYAESEVLLPVSSNGGVAVPGAHQQPTTGIQKGHGVNQDQAVNSQAPLWLQRFVDLHDEFHVKDKICKFHENRRNGSANLKLSLIYYCVTCKEGPLCKFCVDEEHGCGADGTRHNVVRTKTISGNICVSVDDITKASGDGMDYADVKHYSSNGTHVLYLKPKSNLNGSRAAKCIGCRKPAAASHKGGSSRVSLKGGDDPAAEDLEGINGYSFCSILCKIQYVNNPMHSKENRPSMILRSQKIAEEEEELVVKPMMNKVQCVEEKKQHDGKQKKRKTKCEDDVVNGEDKHTASVACKRPKREVLKTEVGKVKKKTKVFSVEDPLRIEIKEMCGPRKVFFAQAPEACAEMSMEDVFGMFKGAGWEVKHFEAGVAEVAVVAAEKKCKKNLKKVLQVFDVDDEKKAFFVNVPTSSFMSDFIFSLLPDFHVAVKELHSHEGSGGSEGWGGQEVQG